MSPTSADFERAQRAYLAVKARHERRMRLVRALYSMSVRFWCSLPGALIVAVMVTTLWCIGATRARGVEVPAWVLRGIAAVETGTDWRDIGDVRGSWSRGSIGEVGPWQLSPAVLRDLNAYDRRHRVHADPVFAESLTRAWLLHLYAATGCWSQSVAAFHGGLAGRNRPHAREYADRVFALAAH